MNTLFDNDTESVVQVEDWRDHSRVVRGERIVKRFDGPRHQQRAEEWAAAYTAGWLAAREQD